MKVTIILEIGNEAMQSRDEIANALINVVEQFRESGRYDYPITDTNGNRVGEFKLG